MDKEKYTFFWGGPLSNFYTCYFTDSDGVAYSCVEQFYASKKAIFFKDSHTYQSILSTKDPKKQKSLGRKVTNFNAAEWYGEGSDFNPAKDFMYQGCYLKFSQNEKFKKFLLETKGTFLVEASPYDKIWGIGMAECWLATYRKFWKGKNWLGDILTKVREDILKKEEENKGFLF